MKRLLIAVFTLLLPLSMFGRSSESDSLFRAAENARVTGQHKEALALYTQLLDNTNENRNRVEMIYFGIGETCFSLNDNTKAIEYYLLALEEFDQEAASLNIYLLTTRARLGYIYRYRTVELKKALVHLKEEHNLIDQFSDEVDARQKFRNAYNLASTTRLLDDYNTALNYGFEALSVAQQQSSDNRANLSFAYSVIANVLGSMKRQQEATAYYLKKIEMNLAINGPQHWSVANDYNNISANYLDIQDYENAKKYLARALTLLEIEVPNKRLLSNTYRHLGATYRETSDYERAHSYYRKAIDIIDSELPVQKALAYRGLALLFEKELQFDSALQSYQQAIGSIIQDFKWDSIEDNPSLEQLFTEPFYYRLLNQKAACWLHKYKNDGDPKALQNAYESFQLMDQLTDDYRNNFTLESSKLFFQDWNYEHYVEAMQSVHELFLTNADPGLINEAWLLIEKNKSLLMLENLLSSERIEDLNVPDSLRQYQSVVSQNTWNLQRDIRACSSSSDCGDNELIDLRAKLAEAEVQLQSCRTLIRQQYPDYFRITNDEGILGLSSMSEHLSSDELLINYFATDSSYYVIATNGRQNTFYQIQNSDTLRTSLDQFLKESSGETLTEGSMGEHYQNFTESAYHLYLKLLAPVLSDYDAKDLIIVPDGLLALLPFEALITQLPDTKITDYSRLNYLIHNYQVQFGYSATLWSKNGESGSLSGQPSLLAFGTPQVNSRQKLASLPGTTEEVAVLSSRPNARVLMGDVATEQNFKKESSSAEIIHLALHNINDSHNPLNSQLVFNDSSSEEDGSLHLYELFGLEMKPELVILSACETGVAEWQKGEGPYHIGRGFLYHGNPAMIVSLWKVRDHSAADLMKELYEKLDKGINSAQALRLAKIKWLENSDELLGHPSNWAAYVGIGQTRVEAGAPLYIYLVIVILASLVVVILKRLKSHNGT